MQFDLIILGGGSAAFAAAIKASELGAFPLIVERGVIGGTCLNRGCVPTKNLLRASQIYHEATHPNFSGIPNLQKEIDFKKLIHQKTELLNYFRKSKYYDVLKANPNITYIEGTGLLSSPTSIEVGKLSYRTPKIIIATGASPTIPPIPGLTEIPYLTSTEALELHSLPKELIVLGGGIVALELAQLFSRLGSKVTIVELLPRIVATEEPEISDALKAYLENEGITILTSARTIEVSESGNQKQLTVEISSKTHNISAEELLVAVGRGPNTKNLNLQKIGVEVIPSGHIPVNEFMETNVSGIYAIGDVIPEKQLVTTAAIEGGIAAENAIRGNHRKMDFSVVPYAVFTDPEVASVGLKESEAKNCCETKSQILSFEHVPKAGAIRDTRGLIKMVIDAKSEKVLGVHMLAPHAADLIHQAIFIIQHKLSIQDVIDTIYVYPTLSEAIKMVAQSFKKDVTKLSCCAE